MGTRADFYIGRGATAEWLGSIAWDGYPTGIDSLLLSAQTETAFRSRVAAFLERDDATLPKDGWPWPWRDSQTTDWAYGFDGDRVWASCFGRDWHDCSSGPKAVEEATDNDGPSKTAIFPDMTARKNVTLGQRSGLTILTGEGRQS